MASLDIYIQILWVIKIKDHVHETTLGIWGPLMDNAGTFNQFQKPLFEARMVAVNETSGAAVAQAGGSPNSKEASPTKVEEQR